MTIVIVITPFPAEQDQWDRDAAVNDRRLTIVVAVAAVRVIAG
jgi:hypothetical protein